MTTLRMPGDLGPLASLGLFRTLSLSALTAALLCLSTPLIAAPSQATAASGATIELSAEASGQAINDFGTATAYFEATGSEPSALSQTVNKRIATALEIARKHDAVRTRSSGLNTYPVYSRDGQRIESWRMRAELMFESGDIAALSTLLGELQGTVAVSNLSMQPSRSTRDQTADQLATEAIRAFEARAANIAATFGKQYRIRTLSIHYGGMARPMMGMMRSASADFAAPAMQVEPGESEITVNVSGSIELTD